MHSRTIKAIVLFVFSYILLYLIYALADFLPKWDAFGATILHGDPLRGYLFIDPLFLLIPLIGFVFMWLALDAYLRHFKDEFVLSIPFALIFVMGSYVIYFIALIGYYWNNAYLLALAQGNPNPGLSSFGVTFDFILKNFLENLLQSPFFVFVLAGLLGWVSYIVIHSFLDEPLPHKHATHTST